jgi:hypothetical protein
MHHAMSACSLFVGLFAVMCHVCFLRGFRQEVGSRVVVVVGCVRLCVQKMLQCSMTGALALVPPQITTTVPLPGGPPACSAAAAPALATGASPRAARNRTNRDCASKHVSTYYIYMYIYTCPYIHINAYEQMCQIYTYSHRHIC